MPPRLCMSDVPSRTPSDATLDDYESPYLFGAPLTRMIESEELWSPPLHITDGNELEEPMEYFVRDEEINYIEEDISTLTLPLNGGDGEGPEGDPLLWTTSLTHVHSVIDHIATHSASSTSPQLCLHATPHHPSYPLLVRHFPSASTFARELALWRYLNSPAIRRDPWNPCPPVLAIVEREHTTSTTDRLAYIVDFGMDAGDGDKEAFVVMDRLWSLQDNPLKRMGDWVDFIRQMLQSLVFLHEHNITQVSYALPDHTASESIMMDIGLAPPQTCFSRFDFPVKYYVLDFTNALRLRCNIRAVRPRVSRSSSLCGRLKNAVMLSASHPRIPSLASVPTVMGAPSVNMTRALSRERARSDSDVTCVSSTSDTPPDPIMEIDAPKRRHFSMWPSSSGVPSDPESQSGSDDETSDEEGAECVRTVSPTARTLLFSADLKNLADVLQAVTRPASSVSVTLAPILAAMRRATALFSAEDALRMFENVVQLLDVTQVVVSN